jgi:hypothetical protein
LGAGWLLFLLSAVVAVIAGILVLHYNDRMKNARNDALAPEKYLASNEVDFLSITGQSPKRFSWLYDWQELVVFAVILFLSVIPTLVWFGLVIYSPLQPD